MLKTLSQFLKMNAILFVFAMLFGLSIVTSTSYPFPKRIRYHGEGDEGLMALDRTTASAGSSNFQYFAIVRDGIVQRVPIIIQNQLEVYRMHREYALDPETENAAFLEIVRQMGTYVKSRNLDDPTPLTISIDLHELMVIIIQSSSLKSKTLCSDTIRSD